MTENEDWEKDLEQEHKEELFEKSNEIPVEIKKDMGEISEILSALGNKVNDLVNTTNAMSEDYNARINALHSEVEKCKKGINGILNIIQQLREGNK